MSSWRLWCTAAHFKIEERRFVLFAVHGEQWRSKAGSSTACTPYCYATDHGETHPYQTLSCRHSTQLSWRTINLYASYLGNRAPLLCRTRPFLPQWWPTLLAVQYTLHLPMDDSECEWAIVAWMVHLPEVVIIPGINWAQHSLTVVVIIYNDGVVGR